MGDGGTVRGGWEEWGWLGAAGPGGRAQEVEGWCVVALTHTLRLLLARILEERVSARHVDSRLGIGNVGQEIVKNMVGIWGGNGDVVVVEYAMKAGDGEGSGLIGLVIAFFC